MLLHDSRRAGRTSPSADARGSYERAFALRGCEKTYRARDLALRRCSESSCIPTYTSVACPIHGTHPFGAYAPFRFRRNGPAPGGMRPPFARDGFFTTSQAAGAAAALSRAAACRAPEANGHESSVVDSGTARTTNRYEPAFALRASAGQAATYRLSWGDAHLNGMDSTLYLTAS